VPTAAKETPTAKISCHRGLARGVGEGDTGGCPAQRRCRFHSSQWLWHAPEELLTETLTIIRRQSLPTTLRKAARHRSDIRNAIPACARAVCLSAATDRQGDALAIGSMAQLALLVCLLVAFRDGAWIAFAVEHALAAAIGLMLLLSPARLVGKCLLVVGLVPPLLALPVSVLFELKLPAW